MPKIVQCPDEATMIRTNRDGAAKQSSSRFLALGHPIDTQRWQLALTPQVSGGCGSPFGGAGLAGGIVAVERAGNGFGHGTGHLWSESGTLLATASQSMIVRDPEIS
jgi:hypothetical protein